MNCISSVCIQVAFAKMFDFFFIIFGISLVINSTVFIIGKRETNEKIENNERKRPALTYSFK